MRDAESIRARARTLYDQASRLMREAEEIEHAKRRAREIAERKKIIQRWAKAAKNRTDQACIDGLARDLRCERGGAALILAQEWARNSHAAACRRNRDLMVKARRGWTNAELAEHFGLSDKHVSRIISEALGRSP